MCSLFYIDETILEKLKAFATEMDSEAKTYAWGVISARQNER